MLFTNDILLGKHDVPERLCAGDTQVLLFEDGASKGKILIIEEEKQQKGCDVDTGKLRQKNKKLEHVDSILSPC